jgi:hypothetical protein
MFDMRRPALVVYAALAAVLIGALPRPARAQFQPRPLGNPATGEQYHVEGLAGFWLPSADIVVSSESLGIPGSDISLKGDLGLTDKRFTDLRFVVRPAIKHKFRFERVPVTYEQSAVLALDIVFNGQKFATGLPVDSTLQLRTYQFGYEYDFIHRDRGFGGLVVAAKLTDAKLTLVNQFTTEFTHAEAPIPVIGGIARVYPAPNVGVTFELTGFKLPDVNEHSGHYVDFDLYGTLNVNDYVGAQVGFRSFDLGYVANQDSGTMKLKGMYFGIVARY